MVKLRKVVTVIAVVVGILVLFFAALHFGIQLTGFAILDSGASGFFSGSFAQDYHALVDGLYSSGNSTQVVDINGEEILWVPWFDSSSFCSVDHLYGGANCNISGSVDLDNNCMVTDEFSQVGVVVAMGSDQSRMDAFYNTLGKINSSYGTLPGWRVSRSGTAIEACGSQTNSNCDTASDADARMILALYVASVNDQFSNETAKSAYRGLADEMVQDFIEYEITNECYASNLGQGDICHWLSSGSVANTLGGLSSSNFAYAGYYPDAILALLSACSVTENRSYCSIAANISLNYLQASRFDQVSFSVPPGRSFKWTNLSGALSPFCTDTCSPEKWDSQDAPRALMMCATPYYFDALGITVQPLNDYCDLWFETHLSNSNESVTLSYFPNGSAAETPQASYFAQGLHAFSTFFKNDSGLTREILDVAIEHYSPSQKTWGSQACFGVYAQSIPMRALGSAIGLDLKAFNASSQDSNSLIFFSSVSPTSESTEVVVGSTTVLEATIGNSAGKQITLWWYEDGLLNRSHNASTDQYTVGAGEQAGAQINVTLVVTSSENESIQRSFLIKAVEASQQGSGGSGGGGSGGGSSSKGTAGTASGNETGPLSNETKTNSSSGSSSGEAGGSGGTSNKQNVEAGSSTGSDLSITGKSISPLIEDKQKGVPTFLKVILILLSLSFVAAIAILLFVWKQRRAKRNFTQESEVDTRDYTEI